MALSYSWGRMPPLSFALFIYHSSEIIILGFLDTHTYTHSHTHSLSLALPIHIYHALIPLLYASLAWTTLRRCCNVMRPNFWERMPRLNRGARSQEGDGGWGMGRSAVQDFDKVISLNIPIYKVTSTCIALSSNFSHLISSFLFSSSLCVSQYQALIQDDAWFLRLRSWRWVSHMRWYIVLFPPSSYHQSLSHSLFR